MSFKTREYERISDEGARLRGELQAILGEHLPADVLSIVNDRMNDLESNSFEMAEYGHLRIYRALMGLIPEHSGEVRAAFQAVVFEGCRSDEIDWLRWERGIEWPLTPDFMDLFNSQERGEG